MERKETDLINNLNKSVEKSANDLDNYFREIIEKDLFENNHLKRILSNVLYSKTKFKELLIVFFREKIVMKNLTEILIKLVEKDYKNFGEKDFDIFNLFFYQLINYIDISMELKAFFLKVFFTLCRYFSMNNLIDDLKQFLNFKEDGKIFEFLELVKNSLVETDKENFIRGTFLQKEAKNAQFFDLEVK
jgi:hypothetical protein